MDSPKDEESKEGRNAPIILVFAWSDGRILEALEMSASTVQRVRKCYVQSGDRYAAGRCLDDPARPATGHHPLALYR